MQHALGAFVELEQDVAVVVEGTPGDEGGQIRAKRR